MSNEDRKKRLKALEDFAFNIDKIVKQPEPVNDEEVILNAPRETTSQPDHAIARQAKVTPSGREQSANTKKVRPLDPPPSGRHSSIKISWPWEDWEWGELVRFIYLVGLFPFYVVFATLFMSHMVAAFGVDPNTSLLILIPPFFFSLILSIITVAAFTSFNSDGDSPWPKIWFSLTCILIPVASGIIFWHSSFSVDFYGQVFLIILTIAPVFGLGLSIFDDVYGVICSFLSFFMLIPFVTLSFMPGFHLYFAAQNSLSSFFVLLAVFFMMLPLLEGMALICSLTWPLTIFVYIIWGLFNSGPFPTSLGDISGPMSVSMIIGPIAMLAIAKLRLW